MTTKSLDVLVSPMVDAIEEFELLRTSFVSQNPPAYVGQNTVVSVEIPSHDLSPSQRIAVYMLNAQKSVRTGGLIVGRQSHDWFIYPGRVSFVSNPIKGIGVGLQNATAILYIADHFRNGPKYRVHVIWEVYSEGFASEHLYNELGKERHHELTRPSILKHMYNLRAEQAVVMKDYAARFIDVR